MLVGVAENNIPFYVKQGFDKYEKTIKNFFIDNYKEEIKDGDLVSIFISLSTIVVTVYVGRKKKMSINN